MGKCSFFLLIKRGEDNLLLILSNRYWEFLFTGPKSKLVSLAVADARNT